MRNFFIKSFYGKKILVTGHTGFKGSWLSFWIYLLGGKVMGVSNTITTKPSHYKCLNLKKKINEKIFDIRDLNKLKKVVMEFKPDYVFHLAAQSIVSKSYDSPVNTWTTNSIGTINLLESLRYIKNKCSVIIITSDKSYKNLELKRGYRENDLLGGQDPYSASKASAELAINSYYKSFLCKKKNISLAVARAGNVIGGGDWTKDRLIPDCAKSWSKKRSVNIRNPKSTRPWQHVLEALSGYMMLAIKIKQDSSLNGQAFNFGPNQLNNYSVVGVLQESKKSWDSVKWIIKKTNKFYESNLLKLNSTKAKKKIGWKSILNFKSNIGLTINWYKNFYKKKNMYEISKNDIYFYTDQLNKKINLK